MRIVKHQDWEIDFTGCALEEIRWSKQKYTISAQNGMTLKLGKYRHWYNIVLLDGRKIVAAVELMNRGASKAGKIVFEPHSFCKKRYRGYGYVEQIYRWLLDEGLILRSCGRQTESSHQMWMKLSLLYKIRAYDKVAKRYCSLDRIDEKSVVLEIANK